MTRPPPLPRPVPFPVYGLDATFTGARNLVLWNQPSYLWTVSLWFGGPRSGEHIAVETLRKAPAPFRADDDFPAEPVGLADAALHGVAGATSEDVRGREAKAAQRALHSAEVSLIDFCGENVVLSDWTPTSLIVTGMPSPAFTRLIGTVRVVVLDLPEVVLSLTVSLDVDHTAIQLVDVRAHLDDYPLPTGDAT